MQIVKSVRLKGTIFLDNISQDAKSKKREPEKKVPFKRREK